MISGSVFELRSGNENLDRHAHDQVNGHAHDQKETNFENKLDQVVSFNPGFKSIKLTDTIFKSNLALLSFKSIEQSVFKLESGNQNISDEYMPKMGKLTNPNFKSNQVLVVSSHPVKFQVDRSKHPRVRVWKPNFVFCMSARQNRQMDYPNFESNQILVASCYPVKFQIDWTKHL